MPAGGAIVGAVLGGISLYRGIKQSQEAKKMAAANARPVYNVPQGAIDNENLAASRADQGIDSATVQAYKNSSDRALSDSLSTILKGGGDLNQVGSVEDASNNASNRFAMADEQTRLQNIGQLLAQRQGIADYQDKAWMLNKYGPYADKAQAAVQLAQAGNASVNSGFSTINSAASLYAKNYGQQQQINQVNGGATSGANKITPADPDSGLGIGGLNSNSMTTPSLGTVFSPTTNQPIYNIDWSKIKSPGFQSILGQ